MLNRVPLILGTLLITGCAFSVYDVKVDYQYDKPVNFDLGNTTDRIKIGEITDARGVENPRLIMNQKNLYGDTTSGGWQAEKPIADILEDALRQGLSKAHAPLVDSGENLRIEGELLDFDTQVIMGMWEGTFNSKMTVKLKLKESDKVVWNDTFVGQASTKSGIGSAGALRAVIDDLVVRILNDDAFLQQLK